MSPRQCYFSSELNSVLIRNISQDFLTAFSGEEGEERERKIKRKIGNEGNVGKERIWGDREKENKWKLHGKGRNRTDRKRERGETENGNFTPMLVLANLIWFYALYGRNNKHNIMLTVGFTAIMWRLEGWLGHGYLYISG